MVQLQCSRVHLYCSWIDPDWSKIFRFSRTVGVSLEVANDQLNAEVNEKIRQRPQEDLGVQ